MAVPFTSCPSRLGFAALALHHHTGQIREPRKPRTPVTITRSDGMVLLTGPSAFLR